jgi:argininosuccinate lyase
VKENPEMHTQKAASGQEPLNAQRFGLARAPRADAFDAFDKTLGDPINDVAFYAQKLIHRAHVVMLAEEAILSNEEASAILRALSSLADRSDLTDYMAFEAALTQCVGGLGSKIHIARSRNDLRAAADRIFYRDQLFRVISAVLDFQRNLASKAEATKDVLMPSYTERKIAQPTTLGYFLMAQVNLAERTLNRLESLHIHMNANPLGAAATTGTRWPINRARTAELLGFDTLVVNALDAVASWDHVAEFAFALAMQMANLARLGSSIELLAGDEADMIRIHDSYINTSSVMPQKRNAASIYLMRNASNELAGTLAGIMSSLNASEYQLTATRMDLQPRSIELAIQATRMMSGLVDTMQPRTVRMTEMLETKFSTMTELCDILVKDVGIPLREAHEIVAKVIERKIVAGQGSDQITLRDIREVIREQTGSDAPISNEDIIAAMDPRASVAARTGLGGPAPDALQAAIDVARDRMDEADIRQRERSQRIREATARLAAAEEEFIRH